MINRIFLILSFSVLTLTAFAQREIIDKVVGKVGGELILLSEIEEQHALIKAQQGTVEEGIKCAILDQLLAQRLMLNQSKLDSIIVADEEVEVQLDARIERILAYMNGDVTQFEAYYGQTVSQVRNQFRDDLKNQLMVERMQASIMSNVRVTPAEIKDFFNSIPVDSLPYFNSEVELGEIVYKPQVNEAEKKKAFDKLTDLKARIEAGEDFAELAAIHSDDPGSGRAGGDLGWQKRNTFVPEFEAAAYQLENNEMSELVETEFGYHLIQTLERRGNTIHARHILIKPDITEADYQLAIAKLDTVKQLIEVDSINFSRAVKKYSEEDQQSYTNDGNLVNPKSGNTFFEISELDPDLYFAIDTMQVNAISSPIEFTLPTGEKAYRLITLKSRTQPHKANLQEDYSKIQEATLESKRGNYINNWIEKKVQDTYIHVDSQYKGCPNMVNWNLAEDDNP